MPYIPYILYTIAIDITFVSKTGVNVWLAVIRRDKMWQVVKAF